VVNRQLDFVIPAKISINAAIFKIFFIIYIFDNYTDKKFTSFVICENLRHLRHLRALRRQI
jgi:hypothetical protein